MKASELCGMKEAIRTMPKLIQSLNQGEVEKYVLTKRGRPVAVMLDIGDYAEMVDKTKEGIS
jgi:antitoxin (DNA-binding transcriptional repressor) of toxin-antitoxin stability system